MEDGDDDTSVTVDGRKERQENVISQDTCNILTSNNEDIEEQISDEGEEEKEVERGRKEAEVAEEELEEEEEEEEGSKEEEEEEDPLLSSDDHQLSTKESADDSISDESKKNSSFESDYSCSISTSDISDNTQGNIDSSADGDKSETGNSFETNKDIDFRDESPKSKEDDDASSMDHDEQICSRGDVMYDPVEETEDLHLSLEEEKEEKEETENSVFCKDDDNVSRCSEEEYIPEESVQQSEFQSDTETHEHEQNSEKDEVFGERSPVLQQSVENSEMSSLRRNEEEGERKEEEEEKMICDDISLSTEKEHVSSTEGNMSFSSSMEGEEDKEDGEEEEAIVLNEVLDENTFIPTEAANEKMSENDEERSVHMDMDPSSPISKENVYLSDEENDTVLTSTKYNDSSVVGEKDTMKEVEEEEGLKYLPDDDVHSTDSKIEEISQPTECILNEKEKNEDEISEKENALTSENNCEQILEDHNQETSPNHTCQQAENHASQEVAAMDINEIDDAMQGDEILSNDGSKNIEECNSAENNTYPKEDNVSTKLPISEKYLETKDLHDMEENLCPVSSDDNITCKEELSNNKDNTEEALLTEENNSYKDDCFSGEVSQLDNPKLCESTVEKCAVNSANTETQEESQKSPQKVNGEVDLENEDLISDDVSDSVNISGKLKGVKRKIQASPVSELSLSSQTESVKGNIHFKGFKKRLIEQVAEIANEIPSCSNSQEESVLTGKMFHAKSFLLETPQVLVSHQQLPDGMQSSTPLTEYAQYLGLQPTLKFKCYKCGESGFPSMLRLQEHQNTCLKNLQIQAYSKPVSTPAIEPAPSTNFRITRKVYLCSACGTYYENWNLFLHMREVHKRHICLFCLGMFSQADKLAIHLSAKHGIVDNTYSSAEQFLNENKGSFFVMCCTCEQMFTERDIFFDHPCSDTVTVNIDQACSLCGLKGAHFPTCRRAFTDSTSSGSSISNSQPAAVNSEHPQSSQLNVEEKTVSVTKYVIPVPEVETERKMHHKPHETNKEHSEKKRKVSEIDDDYDISDAASYCHVNILEPDKRKALNAKGKVTVKNKVSNNSSHNSEKANAPLQTGLKLHSVKEPGHKSGKLSPSPNKLNILDPGNEENMIHENNEMYSVHSPKSFTEEQMEDAEKNITTNSEYIPDEGEEEEEMPLPTTASVASSEKEIQNNKSDIFVDLQHSPPHQDTESARPIVPLPDSASESSDSGGEDSDGSSSSTDASSEENELEERKEAAKSVASDDSGDKSDSDKMSIVVDEQGNDQEREEISDNHSTVAERFPPVEDGQNEECPDDMEDEDMNRNAADNSDQFEDTDNIQIAGDDVPLLELTLEENIDVLPIQAVVKECVKISCTSCVYCNHAKKIAVNGKQLVLHLLAEHRFEPVVCSDSGELTPVYGFVDKLRSQLPVLQEMYFNTDSYDSGDKNCMQHYDRTYECFHCHFFTTLHKDLYVHNRKMHQKTILLCIMCKNNFYSYSELLCHICPGIYVPDSNILFRCCLCTVDGLPSAFRLMVHIRKRHHACDVCLETTGDQQKLSNHVWKHKLHHLCYRCAIAYRNKPDITKHLFWKHGTESVLCKKCLQKKWPHVYHFCIPPTEFLCEECNATFSRAVALKVHKRLHNGDTPYGCNDCNEKFISKKLLQKHKRTHMREETGLEIKPPADGAQEHHDEDDDDDDDDGEDEEDEDDASFETKDISAGSGDSKTENMKNTLNTSAQSDDTINAENNDNSGVATHGENNETVGLQKVEETKNDKKTKVVDVYDIPPLNLSSESDDSDDEKTSKSAVSNEIKIKDDVSSHAFESTDNNKPDKPNENESQMEEEIQPVQVVDGVWDNFNNYKASLEKRESLQAQTTENIKAGSSLALEEYSQDNNTIVNIVMAEHDYCGPPIKDGEEYSQENKNVETLESELQSEALSSVKEIPVPADDNKNDIFGTDHRYFNSPPKEEKKEMSPLHLPHHVPSSSPLHPASPPSTVPVHGEMLCTPAKKKQKSPKKKQKQSASSSSSDSSSNSDSSSCTCGTNCSCSSSSSSSSGSSSSSSDSDSSSSEGRRRQLARRERKREKTKKRLESNLKAETAVSTVVPTSEMDDGVPGHINSEGVDTEHVDEALQPAAPVGPEEREMLIVESDLDTTETETDEDFYDKCPQTQADKILITQKRNQLLLLAEVAPVNNGTMVQPSPSTVPEVQEPPPKKKGKTKRHKKAQHNSAEKKVDNKLKLNIPASYYNSSSYALTNAAHSAPPLTHTQTVATTPHLSRLPHEQFSSVNTEPISTPVTYHSTGSGSETESKRLSKRKRIPKRFYGDSSDEEGEHQTPQPYKWRKVAPAPNTNNYSVSQTNMLSGFAYRGSNAAPPPPPSPAPAPEPVHVQSFHHQDKSDDDDGCDESDSEREAKRSSSDSSNSDSDNEQSDSDNDTAVTHTTNTFSAGGEATQQKNENLYCYCQCPYDEVSEMIACDGKDCSIEWFHFECVGIMVPPKGKWFCPDCRKKTAARSEYLLHA